MPEKIIMKKEELDRKITKLTTEILDDAQGTNNLVLIGIRTLGVYLAKRIKNEIKKITKKEVPLGILDISLYRDDFSCRPTQPKIKETVINFDMAGKHIVLIDDVIWSGRTVRAALDQIIDFGRPHKVRLCVLIDRSGRDLPIEPNFIGKKIEVPENEMVALKVKESRRSAAGGMSAAKGVKGEVILVNKKRRSR